MIKDGVSPRHGYGNTTAGLYATCAKARCSCSWYRSKCLRGACLDGTFIKFCVKGKRCTYCFGTISIMSNRYGLSVYQRFCVGRYAMAKGVSRTIDGTLA